MAKRKTKRKGKNPGKGAFKRCVAKVSKRKGVASPAGVCATAARKKYGAAGLAKMAAAGRKRSARKNKPVKRTKPARRAAPKVKRKTKKNVAQRKNSLEAAKKVYKSFHGRDSEKTVTVTDKIHVHKYLSGLGDLVKMQIMTNDRRAKVTLTFDDGAVLAQNETPKKRPQLYIRGGNQSVNLKEFGIKEPYHDSEVLGELLYASYYTRKDHLRPEDGGEAIYRHRFNVPRPTVIYDTVNKLLSIAGGGYTIPEEGIDK